MKIGLGTAQFGMPYGITNTAGRVPPEIAEQILHRASDAGVTTLDTAAAYGQSESVLGSLLWNHHPFRIVSKIAALPPLRTGKDVERHLNIVAESSLRTLRQEKFHGLLMHRAGDLYGQYGHSVLAGLSSLKKRGLADKIGVSVYSAEEIDAVLKYCVPDIVQIPLNALDQRLLESGHVNRLAEMGTEIHARSVFLQGILLANPASLPAFFGPYLQAIERFQQAARATGMTALGFALSFLTSLTAVETAVVGVTTLSELDEILEAARKPLAKNPCWHELKVDHENLLNPSLWHRQTA